eukprot:gnl/MRDRNA2_/MRDRNA2_406986_c0_seq1.p1 gnl/MRDRNA2_/MRDRNA2_406986_c0~~gnl/MRDRNA2_/MRDRNA2_406986_c0_seq1.p1  ORF type:complete len:131 (+),score=1.11 gnl/MRDRNA2_/MRDRNA2_406986_c0_seq1:109-501(+)
MTWHQKIVLYDSCCTLLGRRVSMKLFTFSEASSQILTPSSSKRFTLTFVGSFWFSMFDRSSLLCAMLSPGVLATVQGNRVLDAHSAGACAGPGRTSVPFALPGSPRLRTIEEDWPSIRLLPQDLHLRSCD